jgi:hypothetical protein
MTKADIIQKLLDKQHITAEEAVVLLSSTELKLEKTYPSWLTNSVYGAFSPTFPNPYTITATNINQIKKEK